MLFLFVISLFLIPPKFGGNDGKKYVLQYFLLKKWHNDDDDNNDNDDNNNKNNVIRLLFFPLKSQILLLYISFQTFKQKGGKYVILVCSFLFFSFFPNLSMAAPWNFFQWVIKEFKLNKI